MERSGKRIRTRARLVEAAAVLFAEKGYQDTTLDAVAARAGMTKGAVYGNFKSKEALLLATFRLPTRGIDPQFRRGASFAEQLRRIGEAVIRFAPIAEARNIRVSDLILYAATHPSFRAAMTRHTRASMDRVAERWRPYFRDRDLPLPMSEFVVLIDAIVDGLLIQRALTPSLVTSDIIMAAFTRLSDKSR
jgi:AcrR family transcriptional regulator